MMSTNKYSTQDTHTGLIRSTSILSVGTLSSRALGFVRDILLARFLGTTFRADAFFVAFRIPNLLRDVLGEGAMNSSVVPVIAEQAQGQDKQAFWKFLSMLSVLFVMILSAVTVLGIVFAPVIVRMLAPGFVVDPEKLALTIRLTRLMFPYLIFIGLTAYGMGILFTFRSFKAPAFGPCLLNVAMIASVLLGFYWQADLVLFLAGGVLVGGALQLLAQFIPIIRQGVRFSMPRTFNHPGARKIGKLLLPRLFGSAVYQMSVFVDTFCASLSFIVGLGGISAIYYANRIFQLPMGLFSFALASAILPTLSGFSAAQDLTAFKRTVGFALRSIIFIMFPISVFLILLSKPIIRVLFERGAFTSYSTEITAAALLFYAIGLTFFAGIKILTTSFHALQDTSTPAKIAGLGLAVNVFLNFLLMGPMKIGGIALASSISATVSFLILFYCLNHRLHGLSKGMAFYALKVFAASVLMGLVLVGVLNIMGPQPQGLRLILAVAISPIAFFSFCVLFKIDQARQLLQWTFQRP